MKGLKFLAAILFSLPLFCQSGFVEKEIDLAKSMPTDINVIGGMISSAPIRTGYGYMATGEGKQLYGFTQEGKLLWQRSAKFRLKNFFSVFSEDMACIVSSDSRISLLNSSGLCLWTAKCDFVVSDAPVQGMDGRIFVRGKNAISCYGIRGTQRWEIETPDQNLEFKIESLNDGSILAVLSKMQDGKSIGTRISPFGVILEEIVFSGKLAYASSVQEGVLLAFSDGSAGLLSVENDVSVSKWTLPSGQKGMDFPVRIVPDYINHESFFIYGKESKIARIKNQTGEILENFDSEIGNSSLAYAAITSQGMVLATKTKACCIRNDGKILWRVKFDPKKNVRHFFATDSGCIVLCHSNWTMELYQARLNVGGMKSSFYERKIRPIKIDRKHDMLPSSYEFGRTMDDEKAASILEAFKKGGFHDNEGEMLQILSMEIKEMSRQWNRTKNQGSRENLFFRDNAEYSTRLLEIAGECQVYFCRDELIAMMKNVSDPSLLLRLIKIAGISAWDPDCKFLDAFEWLLASKKIQASDRILLDAIADSTLEICRFMGRPAFYQKGKNIISYMLYPQFKKETRDKAVETMKKIAESKF